MLPQNNAAIHIDGAPGGVPTRELLRKTYETNVFGVAATINAFVPLLEKAAFPRIVNVSSTLGSLARVSMTDQFWSDMQWPVGRTLR
jgi:NAD(P)-dependent dehydrogenase (short-subunit alcohol dehydrogenase family)